MTTSKMKTVDVNLGADSYTIYIGSGLLQDSALIQSVLNSRQVCIVTNQIIADYYLPAVLKSLQTDNAITIATVVLPEGEPHKNQATLDSIYDCLIENRFSRDCLLIALGGGIVGDITSRSIGDTDKIGFKVTELFKRVIDCRNGAGFFGGKNFKRKNLFLSKQ